MPRRFPRERSPAIASYSRAIGRKTGLAWGTKNSKSRLNCSRAIFSPAESLCRVNSSRRTVFIGLFSSEIFTRNNSSRRRSLSAKVSNGNV